MRKHQSLLRAAGSLHFMSRRRSLQFEKLIGLLFVSLVLSACAQMTPEYSVSERNAEAKDMALVGYDDLQGRSAYQPVIQHQGNRFIAYIGHHGGSALNPLTGKVEPNGTSIVDVTDPRNPRYLAHIPGSAQGLGEAGGAQMVRVCDGKGLAKADPTRVYLLRTRGNEAHEVWDVTDPAKPAFVSTVIFRADNHPQKLVGMRYGYRLPRIL